MALNLLADSLDSLQLPHGGEEVGVAGSLPSHVTHYVDRNPKNEVQQFISCGALIFKIFPLSFFKYNNILQSLSEIVHSYLPSYRHTHPGAPATDPVLLGTINK